MTTPRLTVKQLFDRESCTYTYLLIDADTGEGAIIDSVLETYQQGDGSVIVPKVLREFVGKDRLGPGPG